MLVRQSRFRMSTLSVSTLNRHKAPVNHLPIPIQSMVQHLSLTCYYTCHGAHCFSVLIAVDLQVFGKFSGNHVDDHNNDDANDNDEHKDG